MYFYSSVILILLGIIIVFAELHGVNNYGEGNVVCAGCASANLNSLIFIAFGVGLIMMVVGFILLALYFVKSMQTKHVRW